MGWHAAVWASRVQAACCQPRTVALRRAGRLPGDDRNWLLDALGVHQGQQHLAPRDALGYGPLYRSRRVVAGAGAGWVTAALDRLDRFEQQPPGGDDRPIGRAKVL